MCMSGTFSTRNVATLSGHVEAVFDSSANLRLGGAIWNANIRRDAIHPQGILIPETVLPAIEPGMPARLSPSLFEIGAIRLAAGAPIEAPEAPTRIDAEKIGTNLSRLERHLRLFGRPSVVRATMIEDRDPETAMRINEFLARPSSFPLGGGEGLTPAWDDFLTGAILVDRLLGGGRFQTPLPAEIASRTTELSALQMRWALQGRSALVIEELLAELAQRIVPAALLARCLALGHSSGSDIVTGVRAALQSWIVDRDS